MKKNFLKWTVFFIMVFAINLTIDNGIALAEGNDPLENNDVPTMATIVTLPFDAEIKLDTATDQDWFRVELDRAGALKFELFRETVSDELEIKYEIFTEEEAMKQEGVPVFGRYIQDVNDYYNRNYKLGPGIYYICIQGDFDNYGNLLKYSIDPLRVKLELLQEDELENNDTWENAYIYPLGSDKSITINASNDSDWFKVELDRQGALKFRLDRGDRDDKLAINYEIFARDEVSKEDAQPIYEVYDQLIWDDFHRNYKLEAGIYYIHLRGKKHLSNETYMYSEDLINLNISLLAEDQFESNDTWEDAYLYPLGEEKNITINALNEEDWFKFNLDHEASLKFQIKGKPTSGEFGVEYEIYTAEEVAKENSVPLFSKYEMRLFDELNKNYKLEPGLYYVKVKGDRMYNNVEFLFTEVDLAIYFDLLDEDLQEDNDTWEQAYSYPLGEERTITINAPNDEDWFKVTMESRSALKFEISQAASNDGLGIKYEIYEEDEMIKDVPMPLYQEDNQTLYTLLNNNYKLEAGSYYVRVLGDDCYNNFDYRYSESLLKIKLEGLPEDSQENNDTWENAYNCPLGEEKVITINAANDEDWFKVTLEEATTLRYRLENTDSKTVKLAYSLYQEGDMSNAIYKKRFSLGGNNKTIINYAVEAGTYYIQMASDYGTFSEYDLKQTIYIDNDDVERPEIDLLNPTYKYDIEVYDNIVIEFSEEMDPLTVISDNIRLEMWGEPIAYTLDHLEDEWKVVIKPVNRLNYGCDYTLIVADDVKALDNGFGLVKDYVVTYTTKEKRPTDSPTGTLKGKVTVDNYLWGMLRAGSVNVSNIGGTYYTKTVFLDPYGKYAVDYIPAGNYKVTFKMTGFLTVVKTVSINAYGETVVDFEPVFGDFNSDGVIDSLDIIYIVRNYSKK